MISRNTNEGIDRWVEIIHEIANEVTEKDADLKGIGTELFNLFNSYYFNGGFDIQNMWIEDKENLQKHFRKEELYHYKQMFDADEFGFLELHEMDAETFEMGISILKDFKKCDEMEFEN